MVRWLRWCGEPPGMAAHSESVLHAKFRSSKQHEVLRAARMGQRTRVRFGLLGLASVCSS